MYSVAYASPHGSDMPSCFSAAFLLFPCTSVQQIACHLYWHLVMGTALLRGQYNVMHKEK